jgi:hypothetical protein
MTRRPGQVIEWQRWKMQSSAEGSGGARVVQRRRSTARGGARRGVQDLVTTEQPKPAQPAKQADRRRILLWSEVVGEYDKPYCPTRAPFHTPCRIPTGRRPGRSLGPPGPKPACAVHPCGPSQFLVAGLVSFRKLAHNCYCLFIFCFL